MAQLVSLGHDNGRAIISLKKGETFYSSYLIPSGIEVLADIERQNRGSRLILKKDALAIVEGLHESRKGAFHVRMLREDRHVRGLELRSCNAWPRLRVALRQTGIPTHHCCGGFGEIPLYRDEIAIADFSMSGASGWIISRSEIDRLLAANPLSPEKRQQITERLVALDAEWERFHSDSYIREVAGSIAWCSPLGMGSVDPHQAWWVRIVLTLRDGSARSFGFNDRDEAEDGDLFYIAEGWGGRAVKYRSIPENAVEVAYNDRYRWLSLFDGDSIWLGASNDDPMSRQATDFQEAQIDFMGGEDGDEVFKSISFTRAQVVEHIHGSAIVKANRTAARRIRRTLGR